MDVSDGAFTRVWPDERIRFGNGYDVLLNLAVNVLEKASS